MATTVWESFLFCYVVEGSRDGFIPFPWLFMRKWIKEIPPEFDPTISLSELQTITLCEHEMTDDEKTQKTGWQEKTYRQQTISVFEN